MATNSWSVATNSWSVATNSWWVEFFVVRFPKFFNVENSTIISRLGNWKNFLNKVILSWFIHVCLCIMSNWVRNRIHWVRFRTQCPSLPLWTSTSTSSWTRWRSTTLPEGGTQSVSSTTKERAVVEYRDINYSKWMRKSWGCLIKILSGCWWQDHQNSHDCAYLDLLQPCQ